MTKQERIELRNAWNCYRSSVAAAAGYIAGHRVYNLKAAEKRFRALLWKHRDTIVQEITEPQK